MTNNLARNGDTFNDPLHQVYIVDDDPATLKGVARLVRSAGYEAVAFSSAKAFMERYHPSVPGCLVLDMSLPDLTGLELQQWLMQTHDPLPVIFLSGHNDVPMTVQAMKSGAVDFLTKPVNDEHLLKAIQEASRRELTARTNRTETEILHAKLSLLTQREREVLEHVVSGQLNKEIAFDLGTVEKTIKVHRGRVMRKMGARSLPDLVRLAERVGIGLMPPSTPVSSPNQALPPM